MNTNLTTLTPAEIDALWLEAAQPGNRLVERIVGLRAKADKYRRYGGSYTAQGDMYDAEADALGAKLAEARKAEEPFRAEWDRRGGWTRAYVVPDGHIHRSTTCHTLRPTTLISWLPDQSDWDEERIVEAAGTHACTVCYPTAPVAELRAAEAAAKAASECPGSRGYDHTDWRRTSHTGSGRARCTHCGQHVGTSTTGKLRAHKPAGVTA